MERMPELGARWSRARRAAGAIERRVYDHSLRLGASFCRFHALTLALEDIPDALDRIAASDAPCLRGTWSSVPGDTTGTSRLERAGCSAGAEGASACDAWREAIAGLVLGLTGGQVLHARHASQGHGDARCVDVFYLDPQSPLRFGPIPDAMREALATIARAVAVFDSSFAVTFLGLSENVLYYALAPARGCGAGSSGLSAQPLVERRVRQRFPDLSLFEVTPRTVLGDS
jgi:hypothetical protein